MAKNALLSNAKKAKNDEFYTQFADVEKEMNAYLEYDEYNGAVVVRTLTAFRETKFN
nr:adenine-specific methyltransferase EcoRI family protein [Fibrobacter sp. UWR2]